MLLFLLAALLASCFEAASAQSDLEVTSVGPSPSTKTGAPQTCPVTIPEPSGLVPPQPYPETPPPLYDAVWYGTTHLWTMLHPEGEVWRGLPGLRQKTFWWSERFAGGAAESEPEIVVTGKNLDDATQSLRAGEPGTNGYRVDIGWFMLVGVEFPDPGCWELTAHYGDSELSLVVWVDG